MARLNQKPIMTNEFPD